MATGQDDPSTRRRRSANDTDVWRSREVLNISDDTEVRQSKEVLNISLDKLLVLGIRGAGWFPAPFFLGEPIDFKDSSSA